MKKRLLVALLSTVMVFCLGACTSQKELVSNVPDEEVKEEETEPVEEEKTGTEEGSGNYADITGVVDGDVYTNEYFGVRIEAPEGYSFLSDQMLQTLGYMSSQMLKDGDTAYGNAVSEAVDKGQTVIDFELTDPQFSNNVNMTLGSVNRLFSQDDIEVMIDSSIPYLVQTYESIGATDIKVERSVTTFLGEEMACINVSFLYTAQGKQFDMDMVQIILIRDGYSATITAQADDDETMELLLGAFTRLD
jgi:hypothetical protein